MNKFTLYIVATTAVMSFIVFAIVRDFDTKRKQLADDMAMCIAEQSYTHPMPDKMEELINAIYICEEGNE